MRYCPWDRAECIERGKGESHFPKGARERERGSRGDFYGTLIFVICRVSYTHVAAERLMRWFRTCGEFPSGGDLGIFRWGMGPVISPPEKIIFKGNLDPLFAIYTKFQGIFSKKLQNLGRNFSLRLNLFCRKFQFLYFLENLCKTF